MATTSAAPTAAPDSSILIVQDNQPTAQLIRQNLERAGFRSTCVTTGSDAIAKLNGHSHVLLLVDNHLPDMTGRQLVEKLIEARHRVPFIVTSRSSDERTAVEMMKLGARDYVVEDGDFASQLPRIVARVANEVRHETDQANRAARLRESHRSLSALVRNLPGMAYRCRHDSRRTMMFASEGCVEVTGYRPSDLIDNSRISYGQLLHVEDRATVFDTIETALAQKRPFQLTYRIRTAAETEKRLWEKGSGVFSEDGRLVCIDGFITELPQRDQTQEQLADPELELEDARAEFERFTEMVSASVSIKGKFSDEPHATRMTRRKHRSRDSRQDYRAVRHADLREVNSRRSR